MTKLDEILAKADEKGLSDKEIAEITGRDQATIWRWRNRPRKAFVFDDGIKRLMDQLGLA